MMSRLRFTPWLMLLLLTGCSLVPTLKPFQAQAPEQFKEAPKGAVAATANTRSVAWWTVLNDPVLNDLQSQLLQDADAVRFRNFDTQQSSDTSKAQGDRRSLAVIRCASDDGTLQQSTAGCLQNQFAAATGSPIQSTAIHTPLEPVGRGAVQPQTASSSADRH